MATGNDIVKGALKKAQILGAGRTASDEEIQDGLELMNDTFSELEESVLSLGFQPIENADDIVRIPRGAVGYAKAFLALKMVNEYRVSMPVGLPNEVNTSYNNILIANKQDTKTAYPGNLPIGSGNEGDTILDDKYYDPVSKPNF